MTTASYKGSSLVIFLEHQSHDYYQFKCVQTNKFGKTALNFTRRTTEYCATLFVTVTQDAAIIHARSICCNFPQAKMLANSQIPVMGCAESDQKKSATMNLTSASIILSKVKDQHKTILILRIYALSVHKQVQ